MKFYQTNYVPSNTILAVAGEFNAAELKKKLEEAFGSWPAKPSPGCEYSAADSRERQETVAGGQA